MRWLLTLLLTLVISACQQKGGESVQILNSGIYTPISVQINGEHFTGNVLDLGEYETATEARNIVMKVTNNTMFPMTEMKLVFSASAVQAVSFLRSSEGQPSYPGAGGNCGSILYPGQTCTINLQYEAAASGNYTQEAHFNYKNLVEPDGRPLTFTFLAGTAASLVFTEDKTRFVFGDEVGPTKIPVVERAIKETYVRNLEVKNAGELSARDITVALTQSCLSSVTSQCPAGMGGAYSITHDCPLRLISGQTCNMIISYAPKNQDPDVGPVPPEIEDIRYESTIKAGYTNNPDNDRANLTGYFSSVSATIEAKFDTSIDNLSFEMPVIAGNRMLKQFRVNNTGYREGEFQKIILTDLTGGHVASCIREDASEQYLKCYNQLLTVEKTLAELPFVIKDRDDCISLNNGVEKTFTGVGKGCVYDLYFQPSTTYLNPVTFNLDMHAEYDTRWKDQVVIKQRELQTLNADAQSAARLVITSIRIGGAEFVGTSNTGLEIPFQSYTYDLGRQALLSAAFYKRKVFTITLKNEGQFPARNLSFRDGRNTSIPYQSVNPAGVDLGPHAPYKFFAGTFVDDIGCTEIPPGGTCTIKSNFAPIGLNDEQKQYENMFDDLTAGSPADFIKKFITTFDDGAQYTDGNIKTTIKDIPARSITSNIKATLVTKGVMSDYQTENSWNNSVLAAGNKDVKTLLFRNIGTGPMSYIPYVGYVFPLPAAFFEPTTNLAANDADFDCLEVFDFNYNPADSIGTINSRKGTWSNYPTVLSTGTGWHALPAEKACALTIRRQMPESAKTLDATQLAQSRLAGELGRFYSHLASGNDLWEYPAYVDQFFSVRAFYYDGDYTDPAVQSDPIQSQLGHYETTPSKQINGADYGHAKVIPTNLYPQMGAVLYRPPFTIPTLVDGAVTKAGANIPAFWAIGPNNLTSVDAAYTPFVKGFESKNFITPSIGSLPGGYDYVIFLGSYPVGESHVSTVKLTNLGNSASFLTNTFFETTPSPLSLVSGEISGADSLVLTQASSEAANTATTIIGNTLGVRFNPTVAGRFTNMLTYTYSTGEFVNQVSGARKTHTIKVLFVADAVTTYPNIVADIYDFDVVEQDGVDPIVTMQPTPTTVNPTINNNVSAPTRINFSSIKLSNPTSRDTFVKKRIVIRNTSATQKLYNLKLNLKATPTSISALAPIFIGTASMDQSNCLTAFNNSRTGNGLASLNEAGTPGDSCYIEIKYQPKLNDNINTTLLSFNYELKPDQYIERHLGVELTPIDPATVAVNDGPSATMSREDVYDEFGNTIPQSHPLFFDNIVMTAEPHAINFNQATGTQKRLIVVNNGVTKASFLKSYHDFLDQHHPSYAGAAYPPSNMIPAGGDWTPGSDGYDYTTIYLKVYGDGQDRIRVLATRGCLFGDDEGNAAIPGFQKGFNATTSTQCRLEVYFNASINYVAKEIKIKDPARMKDNYFALKYYNYNRSSVSQIPLYFHLKGVVKPPISSFSASPIFTNVEAKENGTASFSWPTMLPSSPLIGSIVGYRLYYSSSSSDITGDVYTLGSTKFIDINDVNNRTRAFASMQKGRFYYFRLVAVRQNPRYNAKYFPNLADGFFLSEVSPVTAANYLRVVIPLTGTEYLHNQKILVERNIFWETPSVWSVANTKCSDRPQAVLFNSTVNTPRSYSLLTKTVWDTIKSDPVYHDYGNYLQVPHWVSGGATHNIATTLGGQPGYNPAELTQTFPVSRYFYYRDSNNWNALVAMAVGGVLETDNSDYTSLVDSNAEFAVGRCIITLP